MMSEVPILRPRERFIDELRQSWLNWSVIRPTGAFNDGAEIFRIAQRGWAFMLDDGHHRINQIHPSDIADVTVHAISDTQLHDTVLANGGQVKFSQRALPLQLPFVLGQLSSPIHLAGWPVDAVASVLRPFNRNAAGFMRFFRHTLSRDMVGEPVGNHHLGDFYRELAAKQ